MPQHHLPSLIKTAETLQIKGLSAAADNDDSPPVEEPSPNLPSHLTSPDAESSRKESSGSKRKLDNGTTGGGGDSNDSSPNKTPKKSNHEPDVQHLSTSSSKNSDLVAGELGSPDADHCNDGSDQHVQLYQSEVRL